MNATIHAEVEKIRCTINGRTKTLGEWAADQGLSPTTIRDRIARGWSLHDAFTLPLHWVINRPTKRRRRKLHP